ncbi:IS66 family insertion sequence element accessory protein TnpB, partial [Acidiferrobacter thiooxydans]
VDFRVGIDGLAQRCRAVLQEDPFQGTVFVFRSRSHTAIKLLIYDKWYAPSNVEWPVGRA